MAHLTDIDHTAPADSLKSGGVVLNTWRARIDVLNDALGDITSVEADQIEAIGTTAITAAQWVYLSELDQSLITTSTVTFGTINAFTLGGKLTAGAVEIEGSAFDINGGTIDAITHLSISGTAIIPDGEEAVLISCESETVAGNALWITLKSTVTSGDLTGIRSRVYGNAASAGANVRGGYFEAKMAAAGKKAAMLEGALFHADYSAGTATISGDVRGFTAHISQGAGLNAANLYGGLINIQTLGTETITTDDVGLLIRNEAVGGNGRTMDTAIKIADLNMGGGTDGFTYGIDLYGTGIATADIRLSGGLVLAATATLLTLPATALVDITMSLGSDVDGDIYYRSSNKLVRLAKGTEDYVLTMGVAVPEWAASAGGGATTALDNLASVAINTSLISDTDNTDDLGSDAKQWKDLYINGTANIDSLVADTADINGGDISAVTISGGLTWSASQNLGAYSHYINDTANTGMTTGLTINQGAAIDECLCLKSSVVDQPMTDFGEADSYGLLFMAQGTSGGLNIRGLKDADGDAGYALMFDGFLGEAADDTKSTAGLGIVLLRAYVTNAGTGVQAPAANANLVVYRSGSASRFIFDQEGELHTDDIIGVGDDWDKWDDLQLASDISRLPKAKFDEMVRYRGKDFEKAGLLTLSVDEDGKEHAFIRHKAMLQFSMCCFAEVYDRCRKYEQAFDKLGISQKELLALEV